MRTDSSVSRLSFRHSDQWRTDPFANQRTPQIDQRLEGTDQVDGLTVVHSLSGNERNHLFLNRRGTTFDDVSLVSGIDNPADSRGFVTLDYDHDGQLDIALVNANRPLLNLYRNQIDRLQSAPKRSVAIRFEGGNRTAEAAEGLSCRDGFGAVVIARVGDDLIYREFRCGEGYGTQNSSTMIVGIGDASRIDDLTVRWPSGHQTSIGEVAAGTLVHVYETATESAPKGYQTSAYQPVPINLADLEKRQAIERAGKVRFQPGPLVASPSIEERPTTARLYVTMATWCSACVEHLPHLQEVADEYADQLQIIGLPVDPEDSAAKLEAFIQRVQPPYRVATELTDEQRAQIEQVFAGKVPSQAVPAAFLTDPDGRVLYVGAGVPTKSELLPHLASSSSDQ